MRIAAAVQISTYVTLCCPTSLRANNHNHQHIYLRAATRGRHHKHPATGAPNDSGRRKSRSYIRHHAISSSSFASQSELQPQKQARQSTAATLVAWTHRGSGSPSWQNTTPSQHGRQPRTARMRLTGGSCTASPPPSPQPRTARPQLPLRTRTTPCAARCRSTA